MIARQGLNVLIVALSLMAGGCATAPQLAKPIEKQKTFEAPYKEVFDNAITALTSSNQMILMSEKDSGVIGIERQFSQQEIWEYVLASAWDKYTKQWLRFYAKVNLVIRELDANRSKVIVNNQIVGEYNLVTLNPLTGATSTTVDKAYLPSNGKLEEEYLDMIQAQIPALRKLAWMTPSAAASPAVAVASLTQAVTSAPASLTSTVLSSPVKTLEPVATNPKELEKENERIQTEHEKVASEIKLMEDKKKLETMKLEAEQTRLETENLRSQAA